MGVRFTIDHYEPKEVRKDLIADYSNLLWACDTCNIHKGPYSPTPKERDAGLRFFRPDLDNSFDHFTLTGLRVASLTKVGEFTIELLYLNRHYLLEVRRLRQELFEASEDIQIGIRALSRVPLDQLPPRVRVRFLAIRKRLEERAEGLDSSYGPDLLRQFNRSPLVDKDPDAEAHARQRRLYLKAQKALLP
jgi:hypothetical protein